MLFRTGMLLLCGCLLLPGAATLDQSVRAKVKDFRGKVTIYAKNLRSRAVYSFEGEEPVRTASTIKLPIMIEAFAEAAEGKLAMNESLTLAAEEQVSGSGILQDMTVGDRLPVRDVILLMITLSDNTATNMMLTRMSGDAVNARMAALGLKDTRVMRKVMGDAQTVPVGITAEGLKAENKRWGLGRTSPKEMVSLLERLERGEIVSPQASAEMIAVLKKQHDHSSIARDMPDVVVANKAGALDALRSDVGIVYTKEGAVAMAITVDDMPDPNWSPDNPGELMIGALSQMILEQLH